MYIEVDTFTSDGKSSLSFVKIDGVFQCFGLEDAYHKNKIPGKTRIPGGLYNIGIRTEGGFHTRYKKRFPDLHMGMLQVLDVPEFEYILIHCGNTHEDTAGCLLLGQTAIATSGSMQIGQSVLAYRAFYKKVISEALRGNVEIGYIRNDFQTFSSN